MFIIYPKDKRHIADAISALLYLNEISEINWSVHPGATPQDGLDYEDIYIKVEGYDQEVEMFFQMNWYQKGKICKHCKDHNDPCSEVCGLGGDCGWYGSAESCPAHKQASVCGHLMFDNPIEREVI